VPPGFAHGFITLTDKTKILYELTCSESKSNSRGIRWNDKKFSIAWPLEPSVISDSDMAWPDFHCE
jgi:dTDP-4-dehydrorhamnose 3,5-epimerase